MRIVTVWKHMINFSMRRALELLTCHTQTFHLKFYETYIKDKPYGQNFESYATLLKLFGNGNLYNNEKNPVFEQLKHKEELRRNFIQLNVFFEDNKIVYYKDEKQLHFLPYVQILEGR